MKNKFNINKKRILIVCTIVIILIIISILASIFVRNYRINKQLLNNISIEENTTTLFSNGKNINLSDKVYNKIKEEKLDIIIINDNYIARINSQNVTKNINIGIDIKKDDNFENSYYIQIKDDGIYDVKINMKNYIKNTKHLSQYYVGNEGIQIINNDTSIDYDGYCKLNLIENVKEYILAYIIPTEINVSDINVNKGASYRIELGIDSYNYTVGSIKLECSDNEAVEIDDGFNIIGKKVGEYTLYFKTEKENKEVKLNVLPTVEKIELNKTSLEIIKNRSESIKAKVFPEDAVNKELVWTSSDEKIAIVDQNGTVKGINKGNCEIIVSTKDEPKISEKVQIEVKDIPNIGAINNNTEGATYINGILLVNKNHPIPSNFASGLQSEAYNAFLELKRDAATAGHNIDLLSGFRSHETQRRLYNNYVSVYGQAEADTFSARPGTSEHETGLAMDVGWIDDSYGNTPSGKWLADNCYKYGFIIRYMKSKEHITGYKYEPWHIRYLGKEIAEDVYKSGLCLEEYLGSN